MGDAFSIDVTGDDEYVRRRTHETTLHFSTVGLGQSGLRAGRNSSNGTTYINVAVLPFEMPVIPAGHVIIDANLSFSANRNVTYGSTAADLYGLDFRSNNDILLSDFYYAPTGTHDPNASLIQDSILTANDFTTNFGFNTFNTDSTGPNASSNLVSYLNNQIAANTGNFAFFRFNTDDAAISTWNNIGSSSGTSTDNIGAVLSITTAVPEPSAFLFGSLVCTFLGLRSSHRGRNRR